MRAYKTFSVSLMASVALLVCSLAYADSAPQPTPQNQPQTQAPQQQAQPPQQAQTQPERDDTSGRLIIMEENDYFVSNDDRHYTQGARASYLSGTVMPNGVWDQPFGFLQDTFPIFDGGDRKRKYEATMGQSIFTPTNLETATPSPKDRPYAAWLYGGTGLLQETKEGDHDRLENVELLIGTVGPAALGGVTQNDFHQFINDSQSLGWHEQLKDEPGAILTYERKWRFEQPLIGNLAVDAIPEAGASGGNIMTYGETGGLVRFGQNLKTDYGPDRIRPSLSGTGWFDPNQLDGNFGWYLFAGTQGRAVARNIFLDGNTWQPSGNVEKKNLVADFMVGASMFWSQAVRTDFTITERTKEFYGQQGTPDRFGGINLVVGF